MKANQSVGSRLPKSRVIDGKPVGTGQIVPCHKLFRVDVALAPYTFFSASFVSRPFAIMPPVSWCLLGIRTFEFAGGLMRSPIVRIATRAGLPPFRF
jgi:hypothetical protein